MDKFIIACVGHSVSPALLLFMDNKRDYYWDGCFYFYILIYLSFFLHQTKYSLIYSHSRIICLKQAPLDTSTTLHWFAQIGDDFHQNDDIDNGGGTVENRMNEIILFHFLFINND